jgi:tetratricopeptide (TPR) repeat protein
MSANAPLFSVHQQVPRASLLAAAALCVTALAYSNSLEAPFVWDDHTLIEYNPRVLNLHALGEYLSASFWSDPFDDKRGYFRPLTTLTYALDHALWQGAPAGFHLTNLFLHLACTLLVFLLARQGGARPPVAALASAFFAVHPRLTESVAWISGRTDVLATLGALAGFYLHCRPSRATWSTLAAAACVFLGLLSKEVAIAAAVGILVFETRSFRLTADRWRECARRLLPLAVALVLYAWLRLRVETPVLESELSRGERFLLVFQTIGTYAWMLLNPFSPEVQIGRVGYVQTLPCVLGATITLGAGVAIARIGLARVHRSRISGPLAMAATALLLVLNALPLPVSVIAADRFLYLPIAAIAIALAWTWRTPLRLRRAVCVLALVFLALFSIRTFVRNFDWADEWRLWEKGCEQSPAANGLACYNFADMLLEAGRAEEALDFYEKSLAIESVLPMRLRARQWAGALNNYSVALQRLGRFEGAITRLSALVEGTEGVGRFTVNLAIAYARASRFDEAHLTLERYISHQGADEAAKLLLMTISRVARDLSALGPATGPHAWAAKARIWAEIDNRFEASGNWRKVLESSHSDEALRHEAAQYIGLLGECPLVREILSGSPGRFLGEEARERIANDCARPVRVSAAD